MPVQSTPQAVVYKDIPGFPGYRAGSDGSIWGDRRGRVLKVFPRGDGRPALHIRRGGRSVHVYVHQLVAEAFLGPRPVGLDVCHNDNDPTNNVPSNLRYDTRSGNLADRVRHGTHYRGERHPQACLSDADAEAAKAMRAAGLRLKTIAERFGVHACTISRIVNGLRRNHHA